MTAVRKKVSSKKKKTKSSPAKKKVTASAVRKTSKTKRPKAMASKKANQKTNKSSLIGVDPLAWLNEDAVDIDLQDSEISTESVPETTTEATDVEEKVMIEERDAEETQDHTEEGGVIELNDAITIREVDEFLRVFKNRLNTGETIKVDCSELEKIDALGLQLMVSVKREAIITGVNIDWINPSETLRKSTDLLGLQAELSL